MENEDDEGEVIITGRMLVQDMGLFAISLYNFYTGEPVLRIDHEFIKFDRETREFVITLNSEKPNIITD